MSVLYSEEALRPSRDWIFRGQKNSTEEYEKIIRDDGYQTI